MKVGIFYFSGTGNTWYVAKSLKVSLEAQAAEVACHSIEEDVLSSSEKIETLINSLDKLVIGYPIYGSLAPKMMEDFIHKLPTVAGKSISVFSTVALASGDGALAYRDIFKNKGYTFESGQEFITSNNFNVPIFIDALRNGDDEKIAKRNAKVSKKASHFAQALIGNQALVKGDHLLGHFLGNLQRKHVKALIKKVNAELYVDKTRCVTCKKCVTLCPVDNIIIQEKCAEIQDKCIACMRCYHFCPTIAVNITEKSLDTNKWPRFMGPTKEYLPSLLTMKK